jgi:hypothetical protein
MATVMEFLLLLSVVLLVISTCGDAQSLCTGEFNVRFLGTDKMGNGDCSIRFFTICTLVGCGILAPLNYNDTYIADHSSGKEDEVGTLEKLTILNISQGSSR